MEWYGMQSIQSIIPLRVALVLQSLVFLSSSQDRWLTQVAGFGHFSTKKKSRFAKQQQGGRERRLCPAQRLVDLNGYAKESDGIQGFQNPERSTSKFKFHKIDTCHYQTTLQSTNHLDIFSIFYPPCYCHCQVEGGRWCQSCQTSVIFNQTSLKLKGTKVEAATQ